MRKVHTALAVIGMLTPFAAQGCQNQANPESIPDGVTQLTENMQGKPWKAPGGQLCRWWIATKSKGGVVTNSGNTQGPVSRRTQKPGRIHDRSQLFYVYDKHVGQYLHSDKCAPKGWTQ